MMCASMQCSQPDEEWNRCESLLRGRFLKKKKEEASCLTKNIVSISVPHFASSDCALQVLSPASQSECRVHPLCQAAL